MLRTVVHHLEYPLDEGIRDSLVEEITHRVHKKHGGLVSLLGDKKSFIMKSDF